MAVRYNLHELLILWYFESTTRKGIQLHDSIPRRRPDDAVFHRCCIHRRLSHRQTHREETRTEKGQNAPLRERNADQVVGIHNINRATGSLVNLNKERRTTFESFDIVIFLQRAFWCEEGRLF